MRNDFKQLNQIYRDILKKIYSNQNLCKLLYYQESDALSKEDIINVSKLLKDNIHNCHYQPNETDKDSKTHLNIVFPTIEPTSKGGYLKNKEINFIILVHQNNTMLEDGYNRMFDIMQELDDMFNCSNQNDNSGYVFKPSHDTWIGNYSGYIMRYETII